MHQAMLIQQVLEKAPIYGYNVATMKVANMLEDGIIDPTKAVKGAVFAASSIASVVLTSSVIICEDPKKETGVNLNMQGMPMM